MFDGAILFIRSFYKYPTNGVAQGGILSSRFQCKYIDDLSIAFSRVDSPMCTMVDLEMFSTMEFFLMVRVYKGYWNKFSFVAQAANLGNVFNLHKRKMAVDRYRSFLILEPFVLTSSVVPRLRVVSFVKVNVMR